MKKSYLLGGGLTLLAALLTACNSNDDDGSRPASSTPTTTTTVKVTPSLGKILNAKVVLRNAKTGVQLGTGNTGNSGVATFSATKTSEPVVVEVQGSDTAKYVDESKLSEANDGEVNFNAGQKIRVVIPALTSNVGVSTLTEIAYQAALKKASNDEKAISAAIANAANEAIRKALAPELASITSAPTVIGNLADLAAIQNSEAGKYALKLAALAKLISSEDTTPALTALNQLASDIADGEFDGKAGTVALGTYTSGNLATKIQANINAIITAANLSGLGINVSSFNPALGSIVINISGGGGGGTGSGQNCKISGAVQGFPFAICYSNFPQNSVCSANQADLQVALQAYQTQLGSTLSFSAPSSCAGSTVTVNWVQ